ncbi:unnamed protein product (macronuclear) [Paramecium tetraurelia]|uniref:Uncharacterized protein n=1 Tax=Paramecium tetraurelia TaxID=5888 RepID=A0DG27_PARTE|nr:uncharacterized protein GSPATT00002122001 [Paramecium tetraurelia]CAK81994.1 unnamed protein product [Paramecium tetraurelia]|eukprot:XP_001449391.1 hypothetical protein (macronuclear) [Paramecium tetraurelia strain d4-2]
MKKIFPSNNQNGIQVADPDQTTAQRFHQSQTSKANFSVVPSEPGQTLYEIIEKNKLQYLEYYGLYTEQRFIENMAGLMSIPEKQKLLESFLNMFEEMMQCLNTIQNNLGLINFTSQDFQQIYNATPENVANTLFKDIKTLEGLHLELQYQSSLRYLETVLEALDLNPDQSKKLYQLDVKQWSSQCYTHLNQHITTRSMKAQDKTCCCCKV